MEPEPDRLLSRLRDRDPDALGEVYAIHHAAVFRFLLRLCGQRALAEDLFQETWLGVARDASRLRADSDLTSWIFAVARNRFRSQRRAAMFDLRRLLSFAWHRPDEPASPEGLLGAREEGRLARAVFASLSPAFREVLLLSVEEGMEPARVAATLHITPEAARQRLHRARAALAAAMGGRELHTKKEVTR